MMQEVAANKFIQERFVPKLVAAGITVVVDIVRKPSDESHPAAAIVKKADEIDAACIVCVPHEHEFVEVCFLHSGERLGTAKILPLCFLSSQGICCSLSTHWKVCTVCTNASEMPSEVHCQAASQIPLLWVCSIRQSSVTRKTPALLARAHCMNTKEKAATCRLPFTLRSQSGSS